MNILEHTLQLLRKPFPEEESKNSYLKKMGLVSLFVTFFLYVFEPFDLNKAPSGKLLICLGFGAMTFLASTIYDFIIHRLLDLTGKGNQFTFGKWILDVIGVMLAISLANFLFSRWFFGHMDWSLFPKMIHATFTVGIFPTVLFGTINLMHQEKKYQSIAQNINEKKATTNTTAQHFNSPVFESAKSSIFEIPPRQIRYVEALQNYIKIGYINTDGQLIEKTERATLKLFLEKSEGTPIIKCHRSFLVNRDAIESTAGNAQGLLLSLSDCEKTIPVSRSYVPIFRDN